MNEKLSRILAGESVREVLADEMTTTGSLGTSEVKSLSIMMMDYGGIGGKKGNEFVAKFDNEDDAEKFIQLLSIEYPETKNVKLKGKAVIIPLK